MRLDQRLRASEQFRRANRLMLHFSRHIERLTDRGRLNEELGTAMIDTAQDFVKQLRTERHNRRMAAREANQSEASQSQDKAITVKAGVMLLYAEFHTVATQ